MRFQSTPSTRRATERPHPPPDPHLRFNPRPPRGGRPGRQGRGRCGWMVSIHALHAEGDLPAAGRPAVCRVSIHALHAEGDSLPSNSRMIWRRFQSTPSTRRATGTARRPLAASCSFNPRPPRGGRLGTDSTPDWRWKFQSTPSTRRATSPLNDLKPPTKFQSTPSTRRATVPEIIKGTADCTRCFNPRPPRGGRLQWPQRLHGLGNGFNPRPPRGGRPGRPCRWN